MAKKVLVFFSFLLACFGAAGIGALTPPGEWYLALQKPSWNPPSWVFGPVWSLLYLTMAVAGYMVWHSAGWDKGKRALSLFFLQLLLNALWSPAFFGLHSPGLALAIILLLLLAIGACMFSMRAHSRSAFWLFTPYLTWVSFAACLNGALWFMNR